MAVLITNFNSFPFLLGLSFLFIAFSSSNADINTFVDNAPSLSLSDVDSSNRRLHQASKQQNLAYDYYRFSCPSAERIVLQIMRDTVAIDKKVPAQLLRLMFHDCFVEGCDASLLLDDSHGNQTHPIERNAVPNQTIGAFEIIDRIKQTLETECPGVVSCADIIALATRDSIILSGGPFFPLLTGRRDSLVSYFDEANHQIPSPENNIKEILDLFSQRGFNEKETVALLGAHNIGKISCKFIQERLSNFRGTAKPDPSLPADFLLELSSACDSFKSPSPSPSKLRNLVISDASQPNTQSLVPFIFMGSGFDSHYYKGLLVGRGLLYADQQLMADSRTSELVKVFASDDGSVFRREFAKSMLKMSNLGSSIGNQGNVRTSCSLPNS